MATKKRNKKRRSKKTAPFVSPERKKEVLGLILMAFAFLLSLALVTYHPVDNALAQGFSLQSALHPAEQGRAENALGHVGAVLAYLLVPNFLGYTALLLTALLGAWGYVAFRDRTPVYLPLVSVLVLVGAFVIAGLIGWLGLSAGYDFLSWAGDVGLGLAGWMQRLFGTVGSLVLLLLMLAVTLLLVIDHDIQRSMDRLADGMQAASERFRSWFDEQKIRHHERREERARLRDERQEQRAEAAQTTAANEATAPAPAPPAPRPPATLADADASPSEYVTRRLNDLYRNDLYRAPRPERPRDAEERGPEHEASTAEEDPPPASKTPPPPSEEEEPKREKEDVPLYVQEQVKEEKADALDRTAEVPDEEEALGYEPPAIDLLDDTADDDPQIDYDELEENKQVLLDKLGTYNVEIKDINAVVGPTVTRYELLPAPGIKVSKIKNLEDDLAMAMAAHSIRVIAPIPGKSAVGVEIPNRHRELVRLKSVIGTAKFRDAKMELPIPIGKSIEGEVFLRDLTKMPHLLIAGATGSGKSVGLNALIMGLIYACHPANLKFVIIDPKKIELQQYADLDGHFLALPEGTSEPIITDFEKALGVLKSCEKEMEERYDLLAKASVRSIRDYNRKLRAGDLSDDESHRHMPYIVVVVDELADLMMTAGKDIEGPIARLAQMARAVGIHLVLATQRPSVDVITGLIKANFPARIAYQVASRVDSRTILDLMGAEGLVGNGDLLYMSGSNITRLQGPFVSIDEVERINAFVAEQPEQGTYWLPSLEDAGHGPTSLLGVEDTDELFEDSARILVKRQQGSVSLLQRKLSIGYTRAARIVDQLEEAGIVGPFVGTKAREVLVADLPALERLLEGGDEEDEGEETR